MKPNSQVTVLTLSNTIELISRVLCDISNRPDANVSNSVGGNQTSLDTMRSLVASRLRAKISPDLAALPEIKGN